MWRGSIDFSALDLGTALLIFDRLVEAGGPIMLVLMAFSLIVVVIFATKLFHFGLMGLGRQKRVEEALSLWRKREKKAAYIMMVTSQASLPRVMSHAMRGLGAARPNIERIREDLTRVVAREDADLLRYHSLLSAIAKTAPLLGLFATILKLMAVFQTESANPETTFAAMSGPIALTLLPTAVGIGVAVVTYLILAWFEVIAERARRRMDGALAGLLSGWATETEPPAFKDS